MRYLILFVFFYISFTKLIVAQDLIVLNSGDSINCMITSVDNKFVYFAYKDENGNLMNTALQKSKIIDFQREYYGKIKSTSVQPLQMQKSILFKPPKFIISVQGGLSHLTAKIAENIPYEFGEYYKDLKWGTHYGADIGVFINQKLGIGFKHSIFTTTNSINVAMIDTTTGQTVYGIMQDDIKVKFYGPSFFLTSSSSTGRWLFISSISIGYVDYVNHFTLIDKYLLTGNTIGIYYDLGLDLRLDENLALGVRLSLMNASLSTMILDDGTTRETLKLDNGDEEGLSRFDFSLGIRWYL